MYARAGDPHPEQSLRRDKRTNEPARISRARLYLPHQAEARVEVSRQEQTRQSRNHQRTHLSPIRAIVRLDLPSTSRRQLRTEVRYRAKPLSNPARHVPWPRGSARRRSEERIQNGIIIPE